MIENKLDLEWVCDTRVDLVNDELLALMSKAGCKTIWFGVESGFAENSKTHRQKHHARAGGNRV